MLAGHKCLVTGASSGIGRATCQVLTRDGATVIGVGRDLTALESLQRQGHIHDYLQVDLVAQVGACQRVVQEAVEKLGGTLTTVVNAAGGLRGGAVGDLGTDLSNYEFNMTLNAQVPFEIITAAVPYLKQAPKEEEGMTTTTVTSPSIVNVSSVNGLQSFPGCATYCMSKAAVDQLTRCASVDLAPFGIRVNSVNPGVIKTNLHRTAGLTDEAYQQFLDRSINVTHPLSASLKRVGNPEEVGELIAFLVSNKAKFLTGECIAIDGARQNLGAR